MEKEMIMHHEGNRKRLEEEEIMKNLFGKELGNLSSKSFDGSKDELGIFVDIFYGCSAEEENNNFRFLRTSSLQGGTLDGHIRTTNSKHEDSNTSTYSSAKESPVNVLQHTKMKNSKDANEFECILQSSSSWAWSRTQKIKDTEIKSSFADILNHENKEANSCYIGSTSELIQEGTHRVLPITSQGDSSIDCLPPFRVVESFAQGILSSYYSTDLQIRRNVACISGETSIRNYHCPLQQIRDSKAVSKANIVTSPVSQESIASGLLVASPIPDAKEAFEASPGFNRGLQEEVHRQQLMGPSKRSVKGHLQECLESCAHRLLMDSGWKIEPRIRKERNRLAYFFKNPEEGLVLSSLSRTWKACGERLLQTASKPEKDDNGREWSNINEFWSDLKDVLAYIDKETRQKKSSLSLLRRWQLLDPFLAVVFIHRKVSVLRAGKLLRAVQSSTFVVDCSTDIDGGSADVIGNQSAGLGLSLHSSSKKEALKVQHPVHKSHEIWCPSNQTGHLCSLNPLKHPKPELTKWKSYSSGGSCKENPEHAGKVLRDVKCSHDVYCNGLSCQKRKANSSSICEFSEKDHFALCHADFMNIFGPNSPISSDLESGGVCGHGIDVISENEVCKETTSGEQLKSLYQKGNMSHEEKDGISEEEEPFQGNFLESSCDMASHLESTNVFACKDDFFIKVASGLLNKELRQTKILETETHQGKRRAGAKEKVQKNSVCDLVCRSNNGLDHPNYGNVLESHCLDQSECLYRQSGSVHVSTNQEASSKLNVHKKNAKLEKNAPLKFSKDKKDIQGILIDGKPAVTSANADVLKDDVLFESFEKNGCFSKEMDFNKLSPNKVVNKSQSKLKRIKCPDIKEPVFMADDDIFVEGPLTEDSNSELLSAANAQSPVIGKSQQASKGSKPDVRKKSGRKRPRGFHVNDDDLLIAAIIKKKDFGSSYKNLSAKPVIPQPESLGKSKSQKRGCRLVPRAPGSSMDGKQLIIGARTVLCWLIDMGIASMRDVVQVRNPKNVEVIKDGWVTRDGILCKCCNQILSVTEFKAHAGFRQQKPSLNLYMQSGKSYTLCLLQAWSAEYKARKGRLKVIEVQEVDQNDDTCGICGDGGELICCDSCPSTYHQECLSTKELPEGSWYCANCTCKNCNNLVSKKECSNALLVLECSHCGDKYHGSCINTKILFHGDVGCTTWFCGEKCKEVFTGLRSLVGVVNPIDGEFSWTVLRCNHEDQNVYSPQKIAMMAECNSKLAIALTLMEECFVPMVDPRTGIEMIQHVLYNWGSNFARLNYQGFYTVILEKGDTLVSVASVRVHGVAVAEMPLIATCSQQRRRGMCRRLLNAIEMMLKSFKVEVLLLSAIPHLVETWISGFGFSTVDDGERKLLQNINLMLFPGTVLLKKKLTDASSDVTGLKYQIHSANYTSLICDGLGGDKSKIGEKPIELVEENLIMVPLPQNSSNLQAVQGHNLQSDTLITCADVVATRENEPLNLCMGVKEVPFSPDTCAAQAAVDQSTSGNVTICIHSSNSTTLTVDPPAKVCSGTGIVMMQQVEENMSNNTMIYEDSTTSDIVIEARRPPCQGNCVVQESIVDGCEGKKLVSLMDDAY
ncbi:hypothetical protein HPP92_001078 [Vanilla planifolia]|uniref:Increased DNA methylation 1 n=1 Tax=Vanilla planifolia TaxID=51239 RepID=A0A835VF10_VANPL|nr:hypothetical protein HPP92_001078 [Vanilla planifolia]